MLIFRSVLDGVFKYFVIFTPKMGEASHLDGHIFQMAWFNHQPEFDVILESWQNPTQVFISDGTH